MLYVQRNSKGEIIAVQRDADKPGMECKSSVDDEILQFLGNTEMSGSILHVLASTDTKIIRILEDIIELLVKKNIIMFTELPEAAQVNLRERRHMRQLISKESFIVDDII